FFAVPMTFATIMKVDKVRKTIHLDFTAAQNSKGMYKVVKEEGKKAEESSYGKMLKFSNEYQEVDLNLNFGDNTEYAIELVKEYQNNFAKSIRIKVVQPASKVKRALYITFDLAMGEVKQNVMSDFVTFLKSLKK